MSRDADAIVIGGGIVGAACACELARAGLQVLVLDDRRASATAAGMGHLVVMDDNPAELALTRYSLHLWRQWSAGLTPDCAWHPCGTLWLAANADEMNAAEDKQARLRAHGVACDLIDAATLRSLEPELREGLHGALRVSGDSAVYAPKAARWLLGRYPGQVRVLNTEALEIDGDRVRVTDDRWLHADAVVLAGGIHARQLCPELPLRAKKGQLLITDRYPGRVRHQLVELGYVASAHDSTGASVAFNVQPRPTGQLLIGSSREFDDTSPHVDDAMLARMLDRALGYMPGLAALNAIRCWSGVRAATPDGLPLLGPHPERPGLWLATGHEGLGVTTAPASAALLAAMITGAPCELDPQAYLPQRFIAQALAA